MLEASAGTCAASWARKRPEDAAGSIVPVRLQFTFQLCGVRTSANATTPYEPPQAAPAKTQAGVRIRTALSRGSLRVKALVTGQAKATMSVSANHANESQLDPSNLTAARTLGTHRSSIAWYPICATPFSLKGFCQVSVRIEPPAIAFSCTCWLTQGQMTSC